MDDPFADGMPFEKKKPLRLSPEKKNRLDAFVFERDNYLCTNCGSNQIDKRPHHIIKRSQGGEDTPENLTTLCIVCHGREHGSNYIIEGHNDGKKDYHNE